MADNKKSERRPRQDAVARKELFAKYFNGNLEETVKAMNADGIKITVRSAQRYFNDPDLHKSIDKANASVSKPGIMQKEELQQFWSQIVTEDNPKIKMMVRLKASEYLAKSLGMFIEKREITNAADIAQMILAARARFK